ncbi:Pectinesterase-2 precursor, putative [Ricinus communis]|uniref:Pectinesterase n=1 Tax=Ricinus communis TaxID=3988 RepID=B9STE8_RICCO|nr:Pectinesterase-2 precursor, putative [Ricinus communis]
MQLPWLLVFIIIIMWLNVYLAVVYGAVECKNWSENVASTVTVGKSGHEQFKTIQTAIDSIPQSNNKWIKITVSPGVYMEKVNIPEEKPCIFLEGSGRSLSTIVFNAHEETDTSATFSSLADNFLATGITFQNSYNRALKEEDEKIRQAVAAKLFGDKSAFYECGFVGFQDTLWDEKGRHYFYNCYIEGAIDFIFGNGQSFYQDCLLNATSPAVAGNVEAGYITAQSRGSNTETTGFVFRKGSVSGSSQTYLGRAYGPYSRVIFHETTFNAIVSPQGWNAWHFQGRQGNLVYTEIDCKGPGSDTSKRVPWMKKLDQEEICKFSRSSFIDEDGWLHKLPSLQPLTYVGYHHPLDSLPLNVLPPSQSNSSSRLHLLLAVINILFGFYYITN